MTKTVLILLVLTTMLLACGRPSVPDSYQTESRPPKVMPDYTDVTIPANICPLNFRVYEVGKEVAVRIGAGDLQYTYGDGMKVLIDEVEWQELLKESKGSKMSVEVFLGQDIRRVVEGHRERSDDVVIDLSLRALAPHIAHDVIVPGFAGA